MGETFTELRSLSIIPEELGLTPSTERVTQDHQGTDHQGTTSSRAAMLPPEQGA